MEEKNVVKIHLSTLLLFIAIMIIAFLGMYIYFDKKYSKNETKSDEINQNNTNLNNNIENDNIENNIINEENDYIIENVVSNKEENKPIVNSDSNSNNNNDLISKLPLRKETIGDSYYIKNSKLYSDMDNTEITLGTETPKYVLPVNKQVGLEMVLTTQGNVWINGTNVNATTLEEVSNQFNLILDGYNIDEIVDPEVDEFPEFPYYFLTKDKKVIDITGAEVDVDSLK